MIEANGTNRDLLYGRRAIADFIRDDLGLAMSDRQVALLIETQRIPSGFLGSRRIGSRSAIRETLATTARGQAA